MPPADPSNDGAQASAARHAPFGARIETMLLVALLLGIVVLATLQILLRNVFSMSLIWADELIRIAVLWLAVVGAVAASREGRHIAVGIVPRYFPAAWHRPARILASAFAAVVCASLALQSARFVQDSFEYGDTVLRAYPAWPFQAVMPVGFLLMTYRFLRHTLADLRAG